MKAGLPVITVIMLNGTIVFTIVKRLNIADVLADSVDLRNLIWIHTVCLSIFVPVFRIFPVYPVLTRFASTCTSDN